jgi:tetratricopeptide (TPR) repeat protein
MSADTPSYDAWEVLFRSGDWEQCELLASRRVEASQRAGERAFAFEATYDLARVRCVQGQSETARTLLEQALQVAINGGERAYELGVRSLLAQLCAETGQLIEARRHLAEARTIVRNGEDWRGLAGQMSLAEGVVAIVEGSLAEAERHFLRSIDAYRRHAFPWGEAETQLLWGRGLRNTGHAASAANKLRCAEELYLRSLWLLRLQVGRIVQQRQDPHFHRAPAHGAAGCGPFKRSGEPAIDLLSHEPAQETVCLSQARRNTSGTP